MVGPVEGSRIEGQDAAGAVTPLSYLYTVPRTQQHDYYIIIHRTPQPVDNRINMA